MRSIIHYSAHITRFNESYSYPLKWILWFFRIGKSDKGDIIPTFYISKDYGNTSQNTSWEAVHHRHNPQLRSQIGITLPFHCDYQSTLEWYSCPPTCPNHIIPGYYIFVSPAWLVKEQAMFTHSTLTGQKSITNLELGSWIFLVGRLW